MLRNYQGTIKNLSRNCQETVKVLSRKCEGTIMELSRNCQGTIKELKTKLIFKYSIYRALKFKIKKKYQQCVYIIYSSDSIFKFIFSFMFFKYFLIATSHRVANSKHSKYLTMKINYTTIILFALSIYSHK